MRPTPAAADTLPVGARVQVTERDAFCPEPYRGTVIAADRNGLRFRVEVRLFRSEWFAFPDYPLDLFLPWGRVARVTVLEPATATPEGGR